MTNNGIQHLKQGEFESGVLRSSLPAVVDFYADWCGPCRTVGPIIESLSKEYAGRITFAKVNTDENQSLAAKYDVMSIPTVMIFKDGNIVDKIIGAAPAQAYRQKIDAVLRAS